MASADSEHYNGFIQHIDAMAQALDGANGAQNIALPAIPGIGPSSNTMLAFAVIWSLKKAGVTITSLKTPENYHMVVSNIDRYGMSHSFKEKGELALTFAAPLSEDQIAITRQRLKDFKAYASTGWVILDDPERQRKDILDNKIESAKALSDKQIPTLDDIPVQPFEILKPVGKGDEYKMHEVLFHYMRERAIERTSSSDMPDRPDDRLYSFAGSNNSFGIVNYADRQEPIDRAAQMIGVPPMQLTREAIGKGTP